MIIAKLCKLCYNKKVNKTTSGDVFNFFTNKRMGS